MLGDVRTRNVSPVFVGRDTELSNLTAALALAAEGAPQALVLGGEAGVGKSRLLKEFAGHAQATGAVAATGVCVELGSDGLPFAPVAGVLRSLHRQLGAEFTDAATGRESELARLLPELGEAGPGTDGEAAPARLFEFTTRLLERLAATRTLLIAVEDLHWADRSTRELLAYLFRSVQSARLLVVVTYRTDDIHRRHPLRSFLAELDRMRTVQRLELARFTEDEVAAQMAGITGTRPGRETARRVFARSEGNAFFVEELTDQRTTQGLSENLRDLLLVRVEGLAEQTQETLGLVAVGGSHVEHGLLAAAAPAPERDLLTALRQAVGAHVLVPTDEGDGYRFRHALMREAVLDDLLPGERARLNRRYAEVLEASGQLVPADQRAARLASHWYHAGQPDKALPAVLEAAVHAHRRHAFAEQLWLLERALELWDAVPAGIHAALRPMDPVWAYPAPGPGEPLTQVGLLAEATLAGLVSGQTGRAQTMSRQALRLLDERAEPLPAAWFWMQRARMKQGLAREEGVAELRRAQQLVQGLPPSPVGAQVLALAAAQGMAEPRTPEAAGLAERAVTYARSVGAQTTELYARVTLAAALADGGHVQEGITEARSVLERVLERGEISLLGRTLVNLAATVSAVGDPREAAETIEEAVGLARRYGLDEAVRWLSVSAARAQLLLGRWTRAQEAADAARDQTVQLRPHAAAALLCAELALLRGDTATAEADTEAVRGAVPGDELAEDYALALTGTRIRVAAARGDLGQVRRLFRDQPPGPAGLLVSELLWGNLLAAAAAELAARGVPAAEPGRAEALRLLRERRALLTTGIPRWDALAALADAELRCAEGTDAPDDWSAAVTALEACGLAYHAATARAGWAEALVAAAPRTGRADAAAVLRPAAALAAELGARPLADRVDRLAARARLDLTEQPPPDTPAPGTAAPHPADALGLTARERDVLPLVAAGRSNRQIAEELFISPKTASVHVSNILAKLQVSSRGEAGALAHRLGLTGD